MHTFTIPGKVILVLSLCVSITLGGDDFRGAVVEYGAKYFETSSRDTVLANVQSYKEIANTLRNKYNDLKIIVFPEGGLSSSEWLMQGKKSLIHAVTIPERNTKDVICVNNSTEILHTLACIAKNNSVYLLINLIEKVTKNNTDVLYNTNIVFASNGTLAAKYRKFNLYGFESKVFEKEEKADLVYFDTEFGVRFGTFTCFDILFKTPAQDLVNGDYGVSHVLYPAAWVSELPYYTAVQEQGGWAYGTNKVLLAAGLNNPKLGCSGTGIYIGKLGSESTTEQKSILSQVKGDFAIVSYIPKSLNKSSYYGQSEFIPFYNTSNPDRVPLKMDKDKLNVHTTKTYVESTKVETFSGQTYKLNVGSGLDNSTVFKKTIVNETVCENNGGFCCEFQFTVYKLFTLDFFMKALKPSEAVGEEFGQYKYRLAVFNGVKSYDGIRTGGVQVCSIISCLEDNIDSCGKRTTTDIVPESIVEFGGYTFIQSETVFSDIKITARLTTKNNTFVTSNILLSSENYLNSASRSNNGTVKFGKIADSSQYSLSKIGDGADGTATYTLQAKDIKSPASVSLLNRLFDQDGKPETTDGRGTGSSNRMSVSLLLVSSTVLFLKKFWFVG